MNPGFSRPLGKSITCPHCSTKIDNVPLQIVQSKLLIVEGKDDEEFFKAFLKELQIKDIQVAGIGGKTQIRERLKALPTVSDFAQVTSLGIIRDADSSPRKAFKSVRDALDAAHIPYPSQPLSFVKGPPRVGIMILPPLGQKGALEDLCLKAIAADPAMVCIEQFFECIGRKGLSATRELSKAKIRVFLSSREDPTLSLGIAAQKGYWPFDERAFKSVRMFLEAL